MKTNSFVAVLSLAFAAFVSAAPVVNNNKREIVYTTCTEEVVETFWTTTTVWIDPTDVADATATAAASSSYVGGLYEEGKSATSTSSSAPPAVTSISVPASNPEVVAPAASSAPVPLVPAPSVAVPAPSVAAPAPSVASPAVQAPAAKPTTLAYVAPTTPTAAAVAPVASPQVAAEKPAASPSVASTSGTSSTTVGSHVGELTHYDVSVGLSSCGLSGTNSQPLVALPAVDMANGANPNNNPKCGKTINIYYNGQMHKGTVFDTCPGCASGSLDVTLSLFDDVAPSGDGRVKGVSWDWA